MTTLKGALKKVLTVKQAPPIHMVGDGFPVHSMFNYDDDAEAMSPFLLLDYAAPAKFAPSKEPRGVGPHPHRGFETVTIAYQGEIEHEDSAGNGGRIGPGDVQWMTAASGVVHQEKFGKTLTAKGGTIEMVQLWVNLPAKSKMTKPRYQDLDTKRVPAVDLAGGAGTLRVIAGEFSGAKGPAKTFTPIDLWDLSLRAGKAFEASFPEGRTTALFVLHGSADVNEVTTLDERELAILDRARGRLLVDAKSDVRALVLSGEPIPDPVVGYGPFVMNTEGEIRQAIADFEAGKMGQLVER